LPPERPVSRAGAALERGLPARTGLQEGQEKAAQKQQLDARKTIIKLKVEVRRKDRVMAETTSLLVLSKKLEAFYGEDSDSEDSPCVST
jgi:hypothetical protein